MAAESSSTMAEHMHTKLKRRQKQKPTIKINPQSKPIIESDPPQIKCKSTISSLLLSNATTNPRKKVNNFITQNTFRGLGCTSSQHVSVPVVIRSSADWEEKKKSVKKKKIKKSGRVGAGCEIDGGCMVVPDVWCGPGIGFSSDSIGSVDCVVLRRNLPERGKIDDKISKRERELRSSFPARRTVNPESLSFWDSDSPTVRPDQDIFGGRYYQHDRYPSPDGFAEIVMLQNSLLMGGRSDLHDRLHDRFTGWRLDVDNMTYEELLELGERIGHVSTGLKEDEIIRCLWKIKPLILNDLPPQLPVHVDKKCIICQFEFEADDEMVKLDCGHGFHLPCIKQWLEQKNACPVCKTAAITRC
jgi:hypothetical protein